MEEKELKNKNIRAQEKQRRVKGRSRHSWMSTVNEDRSFEVLEHRARGQADTKIQWKEYE